MVQNFLNSRGNVRLFLCNKLGGGWIIGAFPPSPQHIGMTANKRGHFLQRAAPFGIALCDKHRHIRRALIIGVVFVLPLRHMRLRSSRPCA